jgi:hypothetical protein
VKIKRESISEALNRSVDELEISVRTYNCLKHANVQTIGELVQKTEGEMLRTKNFGRKSLNEINEILKAMGLSLGMRVDSDGRLYSPDAETPPKKAEYLLYYLLTKPDRESIPGDLEEEYRTIIVPKFGPQYARIWYWKQVILSVWPIIGSRLRRIVTIGGIAKAAHEIYKRLGL